MINNLPLKSKITKTAVATTDAPTAVGPYAQAIAVDNFVFCSGQIGLDPKTQQLVAGGIEEETRQVLQNLSAVLKAAGLTTANVVRCDIFIKNMADFPKINEMYGVFFSADPKPARQTVEVSNLPKNALIEISCIAHKS